MLAFRLLQLFMTSVIKPDHFPLIVSSTSQCLRPMALKAYHSGEDYKGDKPSKSKSKSPKSNFAIIPGDFRNVVSNPTKCMKVRRPSVFYKECTQV